MPNSRSTRLVAVGAAASLLLAACSWGGGDDKAAPATTVADGATSTPIINPPVGSNDGGIPSLSGGAGQLGFRLSEGTAVGDVATPIDVVVGTPLTAEETSAVLDRLPEWNVPVEDVQEFNRPAATLGPPLPGTTVDAPFPPAPAPPPTPDATADGPLEVIRVQPEDDIDLAPFLSVTFNEPMVPLATLDQLDEADVPVVMTPDLSDRGRWRWIGTRTLRFELLPGAIDRLPAATDYTAQIAAGTTSANGAVLAEDVTWTFSTPPPSVTGLYGLSDSMGLNPVFVATFDQRVDPDAVIDTISFDGGQVAAVRLATPEETDTDDIVRQTVEREPVDRTVAFVPIETLQPATSVSIEIGPGVPSLEGPRTNDDVFSESGSTYGQLKVLRCVDDGLVPLQPFSIELTNQIDAAAFLADFVRVEPAVPGLRATVTGSSLQISGATSGSTEYTITLSGDTSDVFGQTLGDPAEVTCRVGASRPFLTGPNKQFVTTDPFADTPTLDYTTVNHDELRVVAWQVSPDQYGQYVDHLEKYYSDTRPSDPEWPVVLDTVVPIDAGPDEITETAVDLTDAFAASGGPVVVRVEPVGEIQPNSDDYWQNRPILTWAQQTTLGVDVFASNEELFVWTTDLQTGAPVGNVDVELIGTGQTITTDAVGLARVDLTSVGVLGLVATNGERTAMLAFGFGRDGWQASTRTNESRWYVIDDRGIYRPGETTRLTGFVREVTAEDAQLALFTGTSEVQYTAYDPQGNQFASGSANVNALGGFNLSIDIPEESNAGTASVQLNLDSANQHVTAHQFQIQDFRTPDFEVDARTESSEPHFLVTPVTVAADASYFAGGPLPGAEVDWLVSTSDATYRPPNWDDFNFGVWIPWWYSNSIGPDAFTGAFSGDQCFDCVPGNTRYQEYVGTTDADGTHYLQIDFADTTPADDDTGDPQPVDQPTTVTAEATVFDVNRQAISSRTDLLVHPAQYYVGVRSDRTFVESGQPLEIDTTVVDVDGTSIAGRSVEVTAGRLENGYVDGRFVEELVDEQTCTIVSTDTVTNDAPDDSMRCEFATEVGGQYEITAIVIDDSGHHNRAVYTQWVSGAAALPTRSLEQGDVTIVPDRETYEPDGTAELLVQAPFAPASGIVTVTRAGVESVDVFDAPDGSAVLTIPIADDDIPNLNVRVDMVGTADRIADDGTPLPDAPKRPAFAAGEIRLSVPPVARTLGVVATPADTELQPGGATSVSVAVAGPDGEAVAGAAVALIVVDEAVLSLTAYELLDPISVFYQDAYAQLSPELIRNSIILANPVLLAGGLDQYSASTEAPADASVVSDEAASDADLAGGEASSRAAVPDQGASNAKAGDVTKIDVRADFGALAVFAPDETTGPDGTVTVAVELPDNLTRYRVMAVAADGADRFGSGESTITARRPISVRPSAPRFLNFGDRFELPVVVQNLTSDPADVDVAIETANLPVGADGGTMAGQRVTVPANDRIEVRFTASAADVGTARFRVASVAGDYTDAAEIALPVYTPATAEAFATYGVIDDATPIAQPVLSPEGVFPQFGGLEISTSSTALQALTDAVLYLSEYRYDSADGYASRIMAVAALRDVLDAFDADGLPDAAELGTRVANDIDALQALQNDDGGFPYWLRGRESIPWVSVQSAHALVLARDNGYAVDATTLSFVLDHLRDIESHIPSVYSQETKDAISAYALYVRDLAGDSDPAKALALYERAGDTTLQIDSVAQLWPVIADATARTEIERKITNAAVETPAAATFATAYGEDAFLIAHSDRRTDGIVLAALVSEIPESDLIAKVVTGLLANQTRGRWNNAQENSFILLGLNDYFDTFESVDPDFIARAWLGDTYAAEATFRGRSTATFRTTVPMAELLAETAATETTDLIIDKEGIGRLYYRLGLRYAPADLQLDPRDEGFVVERTYEAVDDPDDVQRDPDGTWRIKAGASVRVSLTMVADARRTHVALIDPMPAGFEPLNPVLATSATVPGGSDGEGGVASRSGWWWWNWYEHQNLRDDRAEAFTSYLSAGTYEYDYIARATTPGEFVVPPTRAEEIYAPEVFGRSSSATVIIT